MHFLFCGERYYPRGGVDDFAGVFEDIESAMNARTGEWAHLVLLTAGHQWQAVRRWRRDMYTDRWITEEV